MTLFYGNSIQIFLVVVIVINCFFVVIPGVHLVLLLYMDFITHSIIIFILFSIFFFLLLIYYLNLLNVNVLYVYVVVFVQK